MIITVDECASTQDLGRQWLRENPASPGPAWLRARRQSAGRGRQGRSWLDAGEGSLLVSCALRLAHADCRPPLLSLIAGAALFEAVEGLARSAETSAEALGIFLKWPNDLVWDRGMSGAATDLKKVGGILVEGAGRDLVAGWGLNVLRPPELSTAASLYEVFGGGLGEESTLVLFDDLRAAFERQLQSWQKDPPHFERQLVADLEGGAMKPFFGRRGHLLDSPQAAPGPRATALGLQADGTLRVRLEDGREKGLAAGEFLLD